MSNLYPALSTEERTKLHTPGNMKNSPDRVALSAICPVLSTHLKLDGTLWTNMQHW
jgi:hypothetical protein